MQLLCGVLDVCVDEERVRLDVNILDGNLEAVKASSFWRRDFRCEVAAEIFVDDTIGGGEKSKDV